MGILKNSKNIAISVFQVVDWIWRSVDKGKERALDPLIKHIHPSITPNFLSWIRIALALGIAIMLFRYDTFKGVIMFVFAVAVFSDILDGQIARKRKIETNKGARLDRLGDKLLVCPLVICFLWKYYVVTSLVVGIEFVSFFVLVSTESNQPAKWKMVAESIGIAIIFLFPQRIAWARVAFICALVFGFISFCEYRISFRSQNSAE